LEPPPTELTAAKYFPSKGNNPINQDGGTLATKRRRPFNFENVRSNLAEAIEELEKLRDQAAKKELKEEELHVGLLHAYHHVNFAWNTRRISDSEYVGLTQAKFDRWGKYPKEIETL
jgi:hypothetical protein